MVLFLGYSIISHMVAPCTDDKNRRVEKSLPWQHKTAAHAYGVGPQNNVQIRNQIKYISTAFISDQHPMKPLEGSECVHVNMCVCLFLTMTTLLRVSFLVKCGYIKASCTVFFLVFFQYENAKLFHNQFISNSLIVIIN